MLLFSVYLILIIALPILLSAVIGYGALPRGRHCPSCAQETLPLLSRGVRLVKKINRNFSLQRRWCPACEWEGYARLSWSRALPAVNAGRVATRQTQPVRTIELGGRSWIVMLEYWRELERCYGRLLFVGPSGKLWCDPLAAFDGTTQDEVVEQARALSDRLLAYRLREVISG